MGDRSCTPGEASRYMCMKHQVYLCEDSLQCRDPKIYCKFRSSCTIWFMEKAGSDLDAEENPGEGKE